jgi:hypothetical protein
MFRADDWMVVPAVNATAGGLGWVVRRQSPKSDQVHDGEDGQEAAIRQAIERAQQDGVRAWLIDGSADSAATLLYGEV